MLRIEWIGGDADSYVDLLDDWILTLQAETILVHPVIGPSGGRYQAKCRVFRSGDDVDLDYEPFREFNRKMSLGVLRILVDSDGGPTKDVCWRSPGKTSFEPSKAKVAFEPGVGLAEIDIRDIQSRATGKETERAQLVAARLHQGRFRAGLNERWNGSCALTGLATEAVLRASHMKPWRDCTDDERLDPDNGLLLAAHVDALFDRYLITFDADGGLCWDESVPVEEREMLALPKRLRRPLNKKQQYFLGQHSSVLQTKRAS